VRRVPRASRAGRPARAAALAAGALLVERPGAPERASSVDRPSPPERFSPGERRPSSFGWRSWLGRPRAAARAEMPPLGPPAAEFVVPSVEERRLPNGLTLLVAEDRTLPLVTFHVLLPGGAALDPPGKAGVASLTAELVRQGTRRRSAEELAREIELLGGTLGGAAGTDFSAVSGEFLSKDLDQGLDLFADVVLDPAFREDELRRARDLALAAIVAARENPSSIAERCFEAYLYGAHPYGSPSSGTEASVRALARADVRAFYERHYRPDEAVLVVIGDAPAAALAAKVERAFGAWRARGAGEPPLPAPARVRGRRLLLVDKPDATQTHIRVGNTAIARTDPAWVAAGVTSTILGGGFGSRLLEELRIKRSLTYGAWSFFAARRAPGDFRVGTFTKVETTGEALGLTLDVLRQFAAEGPAEDELARSRSILTGQYPRQLETAGALAGRLAELEAYGLPRSDLETYPARVLAVTAEDVRAVAARFVPADDAAIVVVGPAAAIEPQLAGFGPIDRTTPEACDAPGAPSAVR
jgi:zinc protease